MSANKKMFVSAEEEDSSETDSSSDDEEEGDYEPHPDAYAGNEEVLVDFEGRTPVDPDCHGISQLLSRLFLKAHVNCMQMADLIIAQNYVGSVIGQCEADGDDDADDAMCEDGTIFGVTTVLNITAKKDTPCVEQLRTFLVQRAEKHAPDAVLKLFRDVLDTETRHVGFLINERFINIPAQISVPLLQSLDKELQLAKQKGMKFDFAYFLMVVKFFRKEAHKGKPAQDNFTNAEEEVICEQAVSSFEYSVADECDMGVAGDWLEGDATLTPYRKVLLFDAKQLPQLITDIQTFISGE